MNNFCVFGDSYGYRNDDNPNTWMVQSAEYFKDDVKIAALPGTGQDYTFGQLYHFRKFIQPTDKVVLILTEPGRRWLFKDKPEYSNIWIVNYKEVLNKQECNKLESYVKYIQDDNLDNLAMINRLGWLDSLVARMHWPRPLIIKAFPMAIDEEEYPNLKFAKGALSDISRNEFIGDQVSILKGFDFRYNHLCLSNHKILSKKVIEYFTNGSIPDLTVDFKAHILTENFYKDIDLINNELYLEAFKRWKDASLL